MSATLKNAQFNAGEIVPLQVVVRNTIQKDGGWLLQGSPEEEFSLDVRDSHNKKVALTRWGQGLFKPGPDFVPPSVRTEFIPAGGQKLFQFALNRMFDLSVSGKYSVTVKHVIPKQSHKGTAEMVSNQVAFEIIDPGTSFSDPDDVSHR